MGFEIGSDNEKIAELERQLDDILDSQINSVGGNENVQIDSTLGQRNAAIGDEGGVRSSEPIIHNITENDESGIPTGVFDKINLISSMIIVDHTSTPITLRFIQGTAKDGAKIKITVKKDKVLVIKSGGNILTSSDITISDTEFFTLVKHSEVETGITGGAYKILLTETGSGIAFPIDFPITFLGTIGDVTQSIDFLLSTRHGWKAEFDGDVTLTFDNPPTGKQGFATFKFKQDVVGGHTLTLPIGTVNKDNVEAGFLLGSNEETGIVIQFFNDTFYAFLETGNIVSGGFNFSGNLSDLVIDVNKNWAAQGISNFGNLTGVIGIDFSQTGQSINPVAAGLDYFVDSLQRHEFKTPNGSFLAMVELNPTDRRLDMKQNRVTNIGKLRFSPTFDIDTAGTAEIYETLTLGNLRYVSNNAHVFVQEGVPVLMSIGDFAGKGGLVQDIALLNFNSLTGEFLVNNGDFQLDGNDMKVVSGGVIRNLSDIIPGSGFSGNLSDLVIDANKDWATRSITNMAAIQYVDAGSVVRGSISGDTTLGLVLSTVVGGKFTIQDVITPIATFDDTVGLKIEGTHVINMNKNIINTIASTQWDRTATFTPTVIDTIGFDTATMALKYNVALTTDIHSFQAAGELLASITRINPNVGALLMNGVGSVVQADILSATDKIITNNGFEIQNTSSTITTFAIPNNDVLRFTDGGTEVGKYDADNANWVFNPSNDVQLSPDTDVDLTPDGDVIMNPTGDIRVFADLDMDGTNTIDFGTSASVPPGSALGAIQIRINGTLRLVKFYAT